MDAGQLKGRVNGKKITPADQARYARKAWEGDVSKEKAGRKDAGDS